MKALHSRIVGLPIAGVFLITIWSVPTDSAPGQTGKSATTTVAVDASSARSSYANFARVTATPEEMIVDFALNDQPFGPPKDALRIDNRIIMNFYTAKRLAAAMQLSVERHEKVFGPIEIDAQKRVKEQPKEREGAQPRL